MKCHAQQVGLPATRQAVGASRLCLPRRLPVPPPQDLVGRYGPDAVRYYFMREIIFG
jgi:hypothetical protein